MKSIKEYILENNSTQDEDLQEEVGLALKEFGSVRNGFKPAKKDDIINAMYKLGFDYDDSNSDDECEQLTFVGDYIDDKYEIDLYIDKQQGDKITLKSFNVFKI
jgi:hypothetical protein